MGHTCDAIVVFCIDFRFQKHLGKWLKKTLGKKTYDFVGLAGSTKDLKIALKQIDIAAKLHKIKEAYLIHHENCGAYGNESTVERHTKDLQKAKKTVLKKYPDLNVSLYYARLDGTFDKIEK